MSNNFACKNVDPTLAYMRMQYVNLGEWQPWRILSLWCSCYLFIYFFENTLHLQICFI